MVIQWENTTLDSAYPNITPVHNHSGNHHGFEPVYDTFLILLAILVMAINGLVILLFIWKPFLKESTNYFLVSLAVSDGLTGLCVVPLYFACIMTVKVEICFGFDMTHRLTAFATVYHLVLITCDRYVAITRPFRHSSTFNTRIAYTLLAIVWGISMFLNLIQLAWYDPYDLLDASPRIRRYELHYNIVCAIIGFLVPIIVMILAYGKMLRIVTRHARAIEATTRQRQAIAKEKRAMAIFASMLLVYILCWFPFFFVVINQDLAPNSLKIPFAVYRVLFFLRFCTSVVNPILYVFFKTDFKKALREVITQYHCRVAVTGFLLQNYSVSNNDDDDSSPRSAPRTRTSHNRIICA